MDHHKPRKTPYSTPEPGDNVVITGISGSFPDSYNVRHFRDNLFNKVDLINDDFRRWKPSNPEIPQRSGKLYDIEKFDRGFFGVTTSQSYNMDPMVRMLLEKAVEAILDAGHSPSDLENTRTGVFVGTFCSESEVCAYGESIIHSTDSITGTHRSMQADMISYHLKLKGPTTTTDTACSSTLYALERAYVAIREGVCDKALICGTNLCLLPHFTLQFARLGVLSKDGTSCPFDTRADGYVRAECIAVILLEKAKDAMRIYSEVIYAKTNCDGFKYQGITFPSAALQQTLMKEFYDECNIDPTQLTFVEAHGTGTKVGDPEELNGLDNVFCTNRETPLLIGSVKSNIGHTEPASGLCSIIKTIFAMETGFIPPNINYLNPVPESEGLVKGRMVVVTEKTPLPDQRGLFAVNNFGFGGANCHVLLHWNPKAKIDDGRPGDRLPRLLCISGRIKAGIAAILDDFGSTKCDAEYAYLIQQAFRKTIDGFLYRGYGIFDKTGEVKRSIGDLVPDKPELYFVFSDFSVDLLKLAPSFMEIPIFAATIKSIQNVLKEEGDANILDLIGAGSKDGDLINQILGSVAIQISLANILKEIQLTPYRIIGIGSGELVAAYLADYLTLNQTIIGLFYLACNSLKTSSKISDKLEKCFPAKKSLLGNWIPADEKKLNENCAKYFGESVASNNGKNGKRQLPKHALPLIIGGNIDDLSEMSSSAINLINPHCDEYIVDFLSNLGRLYEYGFDMELNKLYPSVELPVSRSTPMLSSLIRWNHEDDCNVYFFGHKAYNTDASKFVDVNTISEDWTFVTEHVMDGRIIFPGAGYLILTWEALSKIKDKMMTEMRVVFEDVQFVRASTISKDGKLKLCITIQTGSQKFEVSEGDVTVAVGRIYEEPLEISDDEICIVPVTNNVLCAGTSDIYKELSIRGYHYGERFMALQECNVDATYATVKWSGTCWTSYLDSLFQLTLLQKDTRSLLLPITVNRFVIDANKHLLAVSKNDVLPVHFNSELNVVRCGGIEARGLRAVVISRKKHSDPVLEISKFIPNKAATNVATSITSFTQLILENVSTVRVKVVEVCTDNQDDDDLLSALIDKTLDNIPLITADVTVLTKEQKTIPNVTVKNISSLSAESNCLILIATNVLESIGSTAAASAVSGVRGYIISRENLNTDLSKFSNSPFTIVCNHTNDKEMLVLLKLESNTADDNTVYVDLTNADDNLDLWVPKLQKILEGPNNVVVYAQNEELSGILGLVTCLKRESNGNKVSCVLIMDDAPKFDPKLDFYKTQLDKRVAFNIWKDGNWGTYRHLALNKLPQVECEHAYVSAITRGELSSLTWVEGNMSSSNTDSSEEDIIHIYYAALNFKDMMIVSGKLAIEMQVLGGVKHKCVLGMEFAGRNSKGERVFGMCQTGALATLLHCAFHLPIPDDWTMEDAATIMTVYSTVYLSLLHNTKLIPGQTILIHSGSGAVGHIAINLALYYGLTIFVTVGTQEKRDFIKKTFPQIKEEHIGSSRNTFFEDMVYKYTDGRGVDYVLNSLADEKLLASVRCLAKGGKFIEIGKYDLNNNNTLALQLLEKSAQFSGIALDLYYSDNNVELQNSLKLLTYLVKQGAIKPLPRTVFGKDEVEKAFRYIGTGEHIGKVLIKIRDEEDQKICAVPKTLFKAVPRFYCKSECSYIICGGLGGFGFELADLLVTKGAKKIVLTSRSGKCTGYNLYRINMWKKHNVNVVTTSSNASTEEGCRELLNTGLELGHVDGIFNLAAVLKDGFFENLSADDFDISLKPKAHATKNLDRISRELCPNLRYFVVFSSVSCGRGNVGQTNYGMANSVMERVCEKRKREGYPALAIQWGAIGEVGLVAKMQRDHQELVIGGTVQQGLFNCLEVMDNFLSQDEPIVASMVVAEKRYGQQSDNIFDTVVKMIGITNIKAVSMHATFPELGLDSMTAVEIKQTLEREHQIFLTAQDIRNMTLAKLKELTSSQQTKGPTEPASTVQTEVVADIPIMLRNVVNVGNANVPLLKFKTLVEDDESAPHIFIFPGIEGNPSNVEAVCAKLKAHVSCLQYVRRKSSDSIEELAESILPYVEPVEDLILIGYSYGCCVITELLYRLEAKGRTANVIFIDGSPEMVCAMIKTYFPFSDEQQFQMTILTSIMMKFLPYDEISRQKEAVIKCNTLVEKIEHLLSLAPHLNHLKDSIINACQDIYDRLKAANKYRIKTDLIRSNITLIKATSATSVEIAEDYGLSNICQNKVEVVAVEGTHSSIVDNVNLANEINRVLYA